MHKFKTNKQKHPPSCLELARALGEAKEKSWKQGRCRQHWWKELLCEGLQSELRSFTY